MTNEGMKIKGEGRNKLQCSTEDNVFQYYFPATQLIKSQKKKTFKLLTLSHLIQKNVSTSFQFI